MSLGLYVFGILICGAGVLMVGFGVPIYEFSLGNTLIIAGSTAITGGMIVIGLAAAVRQLKRIADSGAVPVATVRAAARPAEAEPVVTPAAPRPAAPPRVPFPSKPRPEAPARAEPRLSASGIEPPEEAIIERPRPAIASRTPVVEDSGDTPLSPRPPFRPNIQPLPTDVPDLAEPRSWTSMPPFERFRNAASGERSSNAETIARSSAPAATTGFFDSVWPATRADEAKPAKNTAPEVRAPEPSEEPNDEAQAVSILKSGVVDGMAYTLYTDGSIEAELAEGTLRFASIEELRVHLEKQG